MKTYQRIALLINARTNCIKTNNKEWQDKHENEIENIIREKLPHGSGIDTDNIIDLEKSTENKIIINSSFHAMDDNGFYNGWIDYKVIVRPSLAFDIDLNIIGNFGNRQDIKEYLIEVYNTALTETL